jgi:hypothetical protein
VHFLMGVLRLRVVGDFLSLFFIYPVESNV